MSILKLLDIDNQQDLQPRFNQRVGQLIGQLRNNPANTKAANEMAELVKGLCEHFVSRHYVRIPAQLDADDLIQDVNINFMLAHRVEEKEISNPYHYISTMLRNTLNGKLRGTKVQTSSDLAPMSDEGQSAGGLMDLLASDGRNERRHDRDKFRTEVEEEFGDLADEMIANNGFTKHEKNRLIFEFMSLDRLHPDSNCKAMLEKYFFGDLLMPQLYTRLHDELGIPEGTVKRQMHDAQQWLDEAIADHTEQPARGIIEGKLQNIRAFRASFKGSRKEEPPVVTVADDEDTAAPVRANRPATSDNAPPIAKLPSMNIPEGRTFISPTQMVRRMSRTATPELLYQLHTILLDMLSKRSNENIPFADGTILKARDLFIPHTPETGGRYTVLIDENTQKFLELEMGLDKKVHPDDWMSVTEFDKHIGRSNKPESLQKTFDFLYELWLNSKTVSIDGKTSSARKHIGFFEPYQGHKAGKFLDGKELPKGEDIVGKVMYVSPKLYDFAREHLPYIPEEKHKDWVRIGGQHGGILERLQIYKKPTLEKKMADTLAVIELLKELNQRGSFELQDPPETKKSADYLGQFMVGRSHSPLESDGVWLVSPDLIGEGKPINKEAVVAKSKEILARPDEFPAFQKALDASRKKT